MKLMRFLKFALIKVALILFTLISTSISATLISVIFAPNSRYIPERLALLYPGGDLPGIMNRFLRGLTPTLSDNFTNINFAFRIELK